MRSDPTNRRSYLLGDFRFFPDERLVVRLLDGRKIWFHPLESQLLELLATSPDMTLSKETISAELWNAPVSREIEKRIRQTVFIIRQALGRDSVKTSLNEGYGLSESIRVHTTAKDEICEPPQTVESLRFFILVESAMYAFSCQIPLFVEIAYRFDEYGWSMAKIGVGVLGLGFAAAIGLFFSIEYTLKRWGARISLIAGFFSLLFASSVITIIGSQQLPDTPTTETFLAQSQTAQLAYAKSILVYLTPLYFGFVLVPFHAIRSHCLGNRSDRYKAADDVRAEYLRAGALNINVSLMITLLTLIGIYSIYSSSYLFDNLRPSEFQNLFSLLFLTRNILYFIMAAIGMWWYYENRKKLESRDGARSV